MDETVFHRNILAHPDEETPRLIYADWLEEQGDPRADYVRLASELCGLPRQEERAKTLQGDMVKLRKKLPVAGLSVIDSVTAMTDPTDKYTMLWPNDVCQAVMRSTIHGQPVHVVPGGHNQQSNFDFMHVQPDNYFYLLQARAKKVFLVARMKITQLRPRLEYLSLRDDPHLDVLPRSPQVLIGVFGSPLRFDLAVPGYVLERWRYRSQKAERGLKDLENGELKRAITIHGIYRLTAATAHDLDWLLCGHSPPEKLSS